MNRFRTHHKELITFTTDGVELATEASSDHNPAAIEEPLLPTFAPLLFAVVVRTLTFLLVPADAVPTAVVDLEVLEPVDVVVRT